MTPFFAFVVLQPGIDGLRKLGKGHEPPRAEKHAHFPEVALQAFVERVQRKAGCALRRLEQALVEAFLLEHGRGERQPGGASAAFDAGVQRVEKMLARLELFLFDAGAHFSGVVFNAAQHALKMILRLFRRGEIADVPAVACKHERDHGRDAFADALSGQKAAGLFRTEHLTAGAAEQVAEFGVFAGLLGHVVEDGAGDVAVGKAGLEVRGQIEVQRGEAHHEVQQAVDGADVERAVAADEHVDGVAGFCRFPEFFRSRGGGRSERHALQPREQPLAHFGGGLVGEGDGENFLPAVGVAVGHGAA